MLHCRCISIIVIVLVKTLRINYSSTKTHWHQQFYCPRLIPLKCYNCLGYEPTDKRSKWWRKMGRKAAERYVIYTGGTLKWNWHLDRTENIGNLNRKQSNCILNYWMEQIPAICAAFFDEKICSVWTRKFFISFRHKSV